MAHELFPDGKTNENLKERTHALTMWKKVICSLVQICAKM